MKKKGMVHMVKIIYLDIDGTLRDERSGIPQSAVQAVHRCRKKGIQIVICTGRNTGSIQSDVMELPVDGIISGGGCYISYRGERMLKQHFPDAVIQKVLSMVSADKLSLAVETEQDIYMDYNACSFYREDLQHKLGRESRGQKKAILKQNRIEYKDNLHQLQNSHKDIHKICLFGEKENIGQAESRLYPEAEVVQKKEWNGQWYLELLPKGCDKGSAVSWLNRRLGILKGESMSFGDSENDIPMMRATGISVAMGGSSPELCRYAGSVCESVKSDGIYRELVRRNIIEPDFERRELWDEEAVVAGGSGLSDLSEKLLRQQQ